MTSSLCSFCTVCRYSRCLSVRCRECRAPTCQQRLSLGRVWKECPGAWEKGCYAGKAKGKVTNKSQKKPQN